MVRLTHALGVLALVIGLAVAAACSTETALYGPDPCASEIRAAFNQLRPIDGHPVRLERIGEGGECGYRRYSPTSPRVVFIQLGTLLASHHWSVSPHTFRDPCANAPASSIPCGGGPLLSARRAGLRFTVDFERAGIGEGKASKNNLYVVAMSAHE
ncbi:MAG TPA: hypothetical protein VFH74_15440 [Gaiellales bacterium]|nr:hypothetical protein [Gaiellales bacterium]